MSQRGAPAAYRGYRLQALYILYRLLKSTPSKNLCFHPEGNEDLDITQNDILIESIQLKSYSVLQLSDLSPEKDYSFLRRIKRQTTRLNPPSIQVINFGEIGPEIKGAWAGDTKHRNNINRKLINLDYSPNDITDFFTNITFVSVNEDDISNEVIKIIQNLSIGIDQSNALDLLMYWLYICSERKISISYDNVVDKINNISRFLAERHAYHKEWFTSIAPLDDVVISIERLHELRQEFYSGVSTRYEHIQANLDFIRQSKMDEIKNAFTSSRTVIVRASSGQGKTTLGLRYFNIAYPSKWRFCIELINDREHALSIMRALAGFANNIEVPLAVYIDVSPRDTSWTELVQRLSSYTNFHILVTIREEDFRRASISGADFKYSDVELNFSKEEGKEIFERANLTINNINYLNFDDAWSAFGGKGPLLEFVY